MRGYWYFLEGMGRRVLINNSWENVIFFPFFITMSPLNFIGRGSSKFRLQNWVCQVHWPVLIVLILRNVTSPAPVSDTWNESFGWIDFQGSSSVLNVYFQVFSLSFSLIPFSMLSLYVLHFFSSLLCFCHLIALFWNWL